MTGLKSPAHLIQKYTCPTSLISSSLTQLGVLYVQKRFFPNLITSASKYCCCPFCPRYLHGLAFFSLHILPLCGLIFVMPSWFVSQTFAMKSLWSLRDQFFKITVAESNGCYVLATYGLCVWGQPLFRRAFFTCPIFSFSSQFTGRDHSDSEWVDWKSRAHLLRKYT